MGRFLKYIHKFKKSRACSSIYNMLVQMNLFTKQKLSHRCRKQIYGYQGGTGRGGINWEVGTDTVAPHSSTPAWKIPWPEEPRRLQSMGSPRVRHDWATSLSLFTFTHWRRKCQPTPVFLPGESQGQRSLVGCHLWGRTESDMTEVTQQQQHTHYSI